VPGAVLAPYPYCYRCPYDKQPEDCGFYCIDMLDRVIESASTGDVGAVMLEPYQGAAGFIFPPDGWLKALEEWTGARDLLLIVDEVQSSFGRTGRMYAIEWEDVRPQMLCLGKGFGSGIPTSALVAEEQILAAMKTGELSSTWGGNPLASAASLAVLDIMAEEALPANAEAVGAHLKAGLLALQEKYDCLGDVRGKGLVLGLEFIGEGKAPAPELTGQIVHTAAERGLMLGKLGLYGNVIRVAPPLVITREEADLGVDILDRAIAAALD
jgi:4-aminobutyrate aminotransferase-like enzyme